MKLVRHTARSVAQTIMIMRRTIIALLSIVGNNQAQIARMSIANEW